MLLVSGSSGWTLESILALVVLFKDILAAYLGEYLIAL